MYHPYKTRLHAYYFYGHVIRTLLRAISSPVLQPMAVLKFLAPTLALWVAPPVMSLIDTAVVGRFCGPTDLAALSPGCTMIDASAYLFMFIATAATNLVASAHAKGDIEGSERIVSEALFMACVSGIFLASIVFVAGQPLLLAIAGHESRQVVPSALKYATIRAFGQPAVVMASVARAAALARKDTKGPLVSVALAFLLNAVGTIALVRGTNLGIMGAAIGTLCADVAATLFLLIRIKQSRKRDAASLMTTTSNNKQVKQPQEPPVVLPLIRVPSLANFRRFCHYAAPIFFTILGKSVVYNGVAVSVGRLGSVALAAHQVLLRSFFFWTPVGDSVGMTCQVFLPGILADEQQTGIPKRGAKRLLFLTGLLAGFGAAALAGLLPSRGAGLFTTDHAVAMTLKQTAPILGISVFMHAIALTCEGMLLAQRDLRFLSISYVITTIATIALLLSPLRPTTLGGSWWILALFQGVRALQFAIRNVWISSRSIEKKA
jgi:Na+-driven multidrug efflux pump